MDADAVDSGDPVDAGGSGGVIDAGGAAADWARG
jgi:hypothetical protein